VPSQPEDRHVFLSYAAEDREVAREIAEILISSGHTVWWDRLIAAGTPWNREIKRALSQARAVVVLWSQWSVNSDYVCAEARDAARRSILIPALIEPCEPPLPFGEFQSLDLSAWRLDGNADELGALLKSLDTLREAQATAPLKPSVVSFSAGRQSRPVAFLVRYFSDLFSLVTGPKSFLLERWRDPGFVEASVAFYCVSIVIELLIGLPMALKLGGSAATEILGTFVHNPIRTFALAAIVHMAWRLVGGKGAATKTLGTFLYMYSLLGLLYSCSQNFAIGLFRLLSPTESDAIFIAVIEGRDLDVFQRVIQEKGLAPSAFLLGLASWPLLVVPVACWGAFRVQNGVSKVRSITAAIVALVLGVLAYLALTFLSFASVGGLK